MQSDLGGERLAVFRGSRCGMSFAAARVAASIDKMFLAVEGSVD